MKHRCARALWVPKILSEIDGLLTPPMKYNPNFEERASRKAWASIRQALSILAIVLCVSQGHAQTAKHLPFYRITKVGATDTSYLFGTMHLLESSYVDTMPRVMSALEGADVVVGEIVLDSNVMGDMIEEMTSGAPLDSLLSKKDYALVSKEVMRVAKLPMIFLNRMSPVMIYALLLEMLYQQAHPENHKTGVAMDLYFQQEGRKLKKHVLGLESAQSQESLLTDSLPMEDQIEELLDLVKHEKKSMKEMDWMLKEYEAGHIQQILDDPELGTLSKEQSEALIYERNRKWLEELPDLLTHQRAFIAVGAGHLAGKDGLIEGLRRLGYIVRNDE
jgi:uncharacterized protein YbaP (TraB family)